MKTAADARTILLAAIKSALAGAAALPDGFRSDVDADGFIVRVYGNQPRQSAYASVTCRATRTHASGAINGGCRLGKVWIKSV